MEDYKASNITRYATTDERQKFATHPSKIVGVEVFRRLASSVAQSGERMLDIGGGAGLWTEILAEEGICAEIFAIDISASMLKERPATDSGVVGDMEQLPFADESFDRVFFFASLHHVKHTLQALQEARRVVKSGGSIILNEPISLRLLCTGKDIAPVDETQFCFSVTYLLRLLRQLGLHVKFTHYQGISRRILLAKRSLSLLRFCAGCDEILNAVPGGKFLTRMGNKATIVAQKP